MKGMNAKTGKALEGIEHLKQSIIDILTTPVIPIPAIERTDRE